CGSSQSAPAGESVRRSRVESAGALRWPLAGSRATPRMRGGRWSGAPRGSVAQAVRLAPAVASSLEGKQGPVLGVANKRSIAWAIAQKLADEGAELAFTFQGERIESAVRELVASVSSPLVTECDVRSDEDVERVFSEVAEAFGGGLDLLVH